MIGGEFEALKAMHAVSPRFIPQPFAHGEYKQHGKDVYFIIVEFRMVGEQPPDPARFTAELAKLHKQSVSPTGKFGFHTRTCHARIAQKVDLWTNSWCELYKTHLSYMVDQDREHNGPWPEFKLLCDITLEHVIPRLLLPLQSEGRSIKPCLVHGDLWDENTATDMRTGEPFIFDPGAFYAHNEYEIGNWRAVRHRLSKKAYVQGYKSNFPASEPGMSPLSPTPRSGQFG
jgi:fructosamine-3-kinase